jgi:hypothetical protein
VRASASFEGLLFLLVFWLVGLLIAYWVIRLAVRHAIQDADRRRPAPPAGPPAPQAD